LSSSHHNLDSQIGARFLQRQFPSCRQSCHCPSHLSSKGHARNLKSALADGWPSPPTSPLCIGNINCIITNRFIVESIKHFSKVNLEVVATGNRIHAPAVRNINICCCEEVERALGGDYTTTTVGTYTIPGMELHWAPTEPVFGCFKDFATVTASDVEAIQATALPTKPTVGGTPSATTSSTGNSASLGGNSGGCIFLGGNQTGIICDT
jgi:hypothetical protein